MDIRSYLHTDLSPYLLNYDANKLIKRLNKHFTQSVERKVIILINAASLHPKMSKYQLSLTHKALGDCYYKNAFFQNALEQYKCAISNNPNIAVKRRIKEIQSMPLSDKEKMASSSDLVDDVLQFPEYKEKFGKEKSLLQSKQNDIMGTMYEDARRKLVKEARLKDLVIDPGHEEEIAQRLDKLGEPYKSEFYRMREERKLTIRPDDPLSLKDYDLLDLEAMERNAAYYKEKQGD